MTRIVHCHWWEFWSRLIILSIISIRNEKLLNSNNNGSKFKLFKLFWDTVVFRFVAYLLNLIGLIFIPNFINKFSYKFDIVLYQFLKTGTSDRTLMCLDQHLKCLISAYTPFQFSCTVPLSLLHEI